MKYTYGFCYNLPSNNHHKIIQRLLAKVYKMNCIDYSILAEWNEGYGQKGYRVEPFLSAPITVIVRPNLYADLISEQYKETLAYEQ